MSDILLLRRLAFDFDFPAIDCCFASTSRQAQNNGRENMCVLDGGGEMSAENYVYKRSDTRPLFLQFYFEISLDKDKVFVN